MDARFRMRMKSTEEFNTLIFNVRGAIQKIRNIIVGTIRTRRADWQTGKTRLAKFRIESRWIAGEDRIDRTNAKTRRTI
jgi:hypothetical protein